jgi:hypothetical protein
VHDVLWDAEVGQSDEIFVRLPATFGHRIKVIAMKWASDELDALPQYRQTINKLSRNGAVRDQVLPLVCGAGARGSRVAANVSELR